MIVLRSRAGLRMEDFAGLIIEELAGRPDRSPDMEITHGLRDSPVRQPESTILGYRSKDASIRLALNRALLMARVQPINEGESPTGGKVADRRNNSVFVC